jgi:subtilisin-like proprotein convertase family protein
MRNIRWANYCFAVLSIAAALTFLIGNNVNSGVTLAQDAPASESTQATFTNATPITIGTTAGATGNPYPSAITVTGLTGNIANTAGSVKVTFNNFSHDFVSDLGIVLVGPGGQALLIQDGPGGEDPISNLTYTLSDTGTALLPEASAWGAGTFKPTAYFTDDSFPAPGPGTNYQHPGPAGGFTATFSSTFGGTAPNGTWNLFVVDFVNGDGGTIAGGWTLEIITSGGAPVPDAQGDYDGDGFTDYAVVRNAGGINGQITWHISHNVSAIPRAQPWGFGLDSFVPADYDGDQKDDIAIWRPGIQSAFHIIQSGTNTLRTIEFGTGGDNPSIVGDYNADGTDDVAVYRQGATAGAQSFFFVSYGGIIYSLPWGLNGDVPAPGDYDGDNRMDFGVQRDEGPNSVFYIRYTVPQPDTVTTLGKAGDMVVPGYYDADAKTDLAVITENAGGFFEWTYRPSSGGPDVVDEWGIAAMGDLPVPGDYNGDGKNDYAIWRPGASAGAQSTFFVMRPITRVIETRPWGLGNDAPVNFTFTHF